MATAMAGMVPAVAAKPAFAVTVLTWLRITSRCLRDGYRSLRRRYVGTFPFTALNDFIEFATIQPHATAPGTIIDFNVLSLCHH